MGAMNQREMELQQMLKDTQALLDDYRDLQKRLDALADTIKNLPSSGITPKSKL